MKNPDLSIQDKTILIIAGQPKAGTTSLFHWLSQHPKIAAGKLKELRFFLDPHYPIQSPLRFDGTNMDAYLSLFKNPERPILLDASPDYIACKTPLQLPALHKDAKAIIALRDPVERMLSAYRFFRSRGLIPSDMTFDQYIAKQHKEGVTDTTAVQYRALDHCRANHYLNLWRAAYGENLLVLDFDEIRRDPQGVLDSIYAFVGIEKPNMIETKQQNKTQSYRYPKIYGMYNSVRRWLSMNTLNYPIIYKVLRPFGNLIARGLISPEPAKEEIHVSNDTKSIILNTHTAS